MVRQAAFYLTKSQIPTGFDQACVSLGTECRSTLPQLRLRIKFASFRFGFQFREPLSHLLENWRLLWIRHNIVFLKRIRSQIE